MKRIKDYCTMFPEGDWANCCKEHDDDYCPDSGVDRLTADRGLRDCIECGGRPWLAKFMYVGVRCLGWFFYGKDKHGNRSRGTLSPYRLRYNAPKKYKDNKDGK